MLLYKCFLSSPLGPSNYLSSTPPQPPAAHSWASLDQPGHGWDSVGAGHQDTARLASAVTSTLRVALRAGDSAGVGWGGRGVFSM